MKITVTEEMREALRDYRQARDDWNEVQGSSRLPGRRTRGIVLRTAAARVADLVAEAVEGE